MAKPLLSGVNASLKQKYAVGEQETLAVVCALELWRCCLDGVKITIVTHHSPKTFSANKKLSNPKQRRWAERIQSYVYEWHVQTWQN